MSEGRRTRVSLLLSLLIVLALMLLPRPTPAAAAGEEECHEMECESVCSLLGCIRSCFLNTGQSTKCINFGDCRTTSCS